MGFLKFLLAVALVILGILGVGGSFLSCVQSGIASTIAGRTMSETTFWVTGIISFVIFLGGIYMLRHH